MCSNKDCTWAFAHLYDESTIDIARKRHQFTITGKQYTVIGTCPNCDTKTAVVIKDGTIIEDDITLLDKESYNEQIHAKKSDPVADPTTGTTDPVSQSAGSGTTTATEPKYTQR